MARRVGLFVQYPFHRVMLEPVARALDGVEVLTSEDVDEIVAFAPDVVVVADRGLNETFRSRLGRVVVVWTRHGLGSKNNLEPGVATADFACVSSTWVRDDLLSRGIAPRQGFWVTGFPGLDDAPADAGPRADGRRAVLYAPTFNPTLSSAPFVDAAWLERFHAALPDVELVIKPHPVLPERLPEAYETWRAASERAGGWLRLVADAHSSVFDHFADADALLTDASSVMFWFLRRDRPIVLFRSPAAESDPSCYDPSGPEWAWREVGEETGRPDELVGLVRDALSDPEARADVRRRYRERIFGDLDDGRAGERIAAGIRSLLAEPAAREPWARDAWEAVTERALDDARGRCAALEAENERLARELDGVVSSLPVRASRTLERFPRVKAAGRRLFPT